MLCATVNTVANLATSRSVRAPSSRIIRNTTWSQPSTMCSTPFSMNRGNPALSAVRTVLSGSKA